MARPTDRKAICTYLGTSGLLAALVVCSSLTGCQLIGGLKESTITSEFEHSNPLQISREKAGHFKVLLVEPLFDDRASIVKSTNLKIVGPIEEADIVYLSEGLAKAGRFKVLSPNELIKEASKEQANFGLMTQEDKNRFLKKVGKSLSVDAVLQLTRELKYYPGFGEFIGRTTMKAKILLTAFSTDSGNVIWKQVQDLEMEVGQYTTETKEYFRKVQLDPLITNFTSTFP